MQTLFRNTSRLLALLLLVAFTQACTIHYSGLIDNKSGTDITIVGDSKKKPTWHVKADEKVKIQWLFKCLEVVEGDNSYYFKAGAVPGKAREMYTVNALYREHQLYYLLDDGSVKALDVCTEEDLKK
ncbi:hypothetical protein FT643_16815 [Ketobacter sp. MCCC 1A13808]|mgnify:CR=1 FL=1|uniref:hypothetical protein n=1 Tax=Ketobacter sp. MCCC 1A13808 TaxID=2602738 RepID=UPI000F0F1B64|nr:hypothetical protein [Ketobacter sp. MCCC 1A13808]MVF13805.1 hypothetical protein [Ketobacter sp. MCCC 1A13808]RLP54858.1 MAG: hypothetical protein D6160_08585 [Ketobacter sp.]